VELSASTRVRTIEDARLATLKIVAWFSCGNNSAVAAKLASEIFLPDELRIVRCVVANEHADNDRFHTDVERWIGRPIERIQSEKYLDCWAVWEERKFLSGIKGAPCTAEMKKVPRWAFERVWAPDYQVFGFSSDEAKRADRFLALNPEVRLLRLLESEHITKPMCATLIEGAGIELPAMYRMGFSNNNCICCVKATSIVYWARSRHFFPVEFSRMAELSRRLGCRLTRLLGKRIFIDEIPLDFHWETKYDRNRAECGVLCTGDSK